MAMLLIVTASSCTQSERPLTPQKEARPIMMAPNSALTPSLVTPTTHNALGQQARFQAKAASYRRAANQASGAEREQLLQLAEQMDQQAAAVAPR